MSLKGWTQVLCFQGKCLPKLSPQPLHLFLSFCFNFSLTGRRIFLSPSGIRHIIIYYKVVYEGSHSNSKAAGRASEWPRIQLYYTEVWDTAESSLSMHIFFCPSLFISSFCFRLPFWWAGNVTKIRSLGTFSKDLIWIIYKLLVSLDLQIFCCKSGLHYQSQLGNWCQAMLD